MADTSERVLRFHTLLGNGKLPDVQARLYRDFPKSLGYSSKRRDSLLFEATLVLALTQASKAEGDKELHKVYFLAPATVADGWVLAEFRSAAKRIFDSLRARGSIAAVKHVGELFHQVMLGSQVFTLPSEPDRWVAFGFSKADQIPEWLRQKLLEVEGEGGDLRAGV